jgi:hypothetical protein
MFIALVGIGFGLVYFMADSHSVSTTDVLLIAGFLLAIIALLWLLLIFVQRRNRLAIVIAALVLPTATDYLVGVYTTPKFDVLNLQGISVATWTVSIAVTALLWFVYIRELRHK